MKQRSAGERYAEMVSAGEIQTDPAQREVIAYLELLAEGLRKVQHRSWWKRFVGRPEAVKGLYLWGRVGRGKTLLTELFLEDLGHIQGEVRVKRSVTIFEGHSAQALDQGLVVGILYGSHGRDGQGRHT